MAQLVEHDLAKVGVAGSNPVVRSIAIQKVPKGAFFIAAKKRDSDPHEGTERLENMPVAYF